MIHRTIARFYGAAIVPGAICCLFGAANPAFAQTLSGTIVFDSQRSGPTQIYSMSANGTNVRRLTRAGFYDYHPCWSPDGTKIAFLSWSDSTLISSLCMMDSVGGSRTTILSTTSDLFCPTWSPNGRWLAYGAREGLYVIDLNARRWTPVLISSRTGVTMPTFSPDSQQMAFSYQYQSSTSPGDIFRINVDGSGLVNITNTPNVSETCPAWNADSIAYLVGTGNGFNGDIYVMDISGISRSQITQGGLAFSRPAWSPDGKWIAFCKQTAPYEYSLWATPRTGGSIVQLSSGYMDCNPCWKP